MLGQESGTRKGRAAEANSVSYAHQPGFARVLPPYERHALGGAEHGARVDGAPQTCHLEALPPLYGYFQPAGLCAVWCNVVLYAACLLELNLRESTALIILALGV